MAYIAANNPRRAALYLTLLHRKQTAIKEETMFKSLLGTSVAITILAAGLLVSVSAEPGAAASLRHNRAHWNSVRNHAEITSFSSSSHYPIGSNHHFR
jgi:hypothetical protein